MFNDFSSPLLCSYLRTNVMFNSGRERDKEKENAWMRAKKNMYKTIDSQRARVTESICICHSFDQILNTNASWTIDKGQVYTHSYASRFPFPPVMIMMMMIIVQRVQREGVNYTHEEAEKAYFLTYSAASARIEFQRGECPSFVGFEDEFRASLQQWFN